MNEDQMKENQTAYLLRESLLEEMCLLPGGPCTAVVDIIPFLKKKQLTKNPNLFGYLSLQIVGCLALLNQWEIAKDPSEMIDDPSGTRDILEKACKITSRRIEKILRKIEECKEDPHYHDEREG